MPKPAGAPRSRTAAAARALCVAGAVFLCAAAQAVTPVHKCVVNGTTTFQRDPCPSSRPQPAPTTQQLNQDRKQKAEAAEAVRKTQSPPAATATESAAPEPRSAPAPRLPERPAPAPQYRCDGRKYCSQMSSCQEAMYFLAHCPGVKMDGDGDGIPCERQWCGR